MEYHTADKNDCTTSMYVKMDKLQNHDKKQVENRSIELNIIYVPYKHTFNAMYYSCVHINVIKI